MPTWIDFTANKLAWGFVHERSDKLEQRLLLRPASTRQEVRQFNAGDSLHRYQRSPFGLLYSSFVRMLFMRILDTRINVC